MSSTMPIPTGNQTLSSEPSEMPQERRFEITDYEELSKDELYAILWLRNVVFVVGQKITAEPEIDGRDPECAHAMLWIGERLVGTARVFGRQDPAVIGRVAVHPDHQRQGLGSALMEGIQDHLGPCDAQLHAQAYLEDWYTRLGWQRYGEEFEEAEIPHVMMRWPGPG